MIVVDLPPSADVDEKGHAYCGPKRSQSRCRLGIANTKGILPDWAVKCGYPPDIPCLLDPAPEGGIPIHSALHGVLDKDVHEGYDEGDPIAAKQVRYLHLPKLLSIKLVVKGEINIYGHC